MSDEEDFNPQRFRLTPELQAALGAAKSKSKAKAKPKSATKKQADGKKFAYVPLPWGYRALTVAGRGAAIVAHALYIQRTKGRGDVPITAAVLKQCGVSRKTRSQTLSNLEAAGMATVRRRGKKSQGCPLLTMLMPEQDGAEK
jgi:hypothetical protein